MTILVLKVTITPVVIAAATIAARRFGPAVGGWLIGLPVTAGPVGLFLALEHGATFARHVADGFVAGVSAQAAFVLGYVAFAVRGARWWAALLSGSAAFAAAGVALEAASPPLLALLAIGISALVIGLRLVRVAPGVRVPRPTRWELPLRMALSTAVVVSITGFATELGPGPSGLITTYPILSTLLAVFAHHSAGGRAAVAVYRGLLAGLFALIGFAATLGILLSHLPLAAVFGLAVALTLLIQMSSLQLARRTGG